MKISALFTPAFLVATALASDAEPSPSSASPSSSSSSSSSTPKPDPTPIGAIWAPKWTSPDLAPYKRHCASSSAFTASLYKLSDMYPALETWAPQLKVFYNKQHYPGSWAGEDKHGNERELLKMELAALPYAVRDWIKTNPRQKHFSVQDDLVFFAPGAMYPILPLFVEGAEEGECEQILEDLENYSAELRDGAVVGTVEYGKREGKAVEITVSAFQVVKAEKARDEL